MRLVYRRKYSVNKELLKHVYGPCCVLGGSRLAKIYLLLFMSTKLRQVKLVSMVTELIEGVLVVETILSAARSCALGHLITSSGTTPCESRAAPGHADKYTISILQTCDLAFPLPGFCTAGARTGYNAPGTNLFHTFGDGHSSQDWHSPQCIC